MNLKEKISMHTAARATGLAFILMAIIAPFAILFILEKLIMPGDTTTSISNIKANQLLFGVAIVLYYIVLGLDIIVAIALYILFERVNKNISMLGAIMRLIYTGIVMISLLFLVLLFVEVYTTGYLISYIFFIAHLFILGLLVLKSNYIPKIFGIILIIGAFGYILTSYGHFFIPAEIFDIIYTIATIPASICEIILGVWLLVKAFKLPE